jgi:hypothetical protein
MKILNIIIYIIFMPVFIHATIQRAPGQPLAKPTKSSKKTETITKYVVSIRKIEDRTDGSTEYDINIKSIVGTEDAKKLFKEVATKLVNHGHDTGNDNLDLSTHRREESVERIPYGDWRD